MRDKYLMSPNYMLKNIDSSACMFKKICIISKTPGRLLTDV